MEAWYHEHGAALLLFGIALTGGHRGRAQDALHQVFLRLLGRNLGHIADVRTYLFAALRNTLNDDAKRRGRDVPLAPDNESSWFESPNDYVEELSVRRALTELPADQREVVVLHIWGGLTFSQAAEVLGINANTAAARYRYALTKLRGSLSVGNREDARA